MDVGTKLTIYKIQRKTDGLFSNGLPKPSFNKNGRIWTKIGSLKMHLHLLDRTPWDYHDCKIVAYSGIMEIDEDKTEELLNVTDEYAKRRIIKKLSGK